MVVPMNRNTVEQFINEVKILCNRFNNLILADERFRDNVKSVPKKMEISYDLANFYTSRLPCELLRFEKNDDSCLDFRVNSIDLHSGLKKVEICTHRGILIEITPDPYVYLRDNQWTYMAYDNKFTLENVDLAVDISASEKPLTDSVILKMIEAVFL